MHETWDKAFICFEGCYADGSMEEHYEPEDIREQFINHISYGFTHMNDIPVA